MSEDEMRQALELAVHMWMNKSASGHEVWECKGAAEAVLPEVRRIVADELRARADVLGYTPLSERESGRIGEHTAVWHAAAEVVRARADELDPR